MTSPPDDASQGAARWIVLAGVWLAYCAFGATAAGLAPLLPEVREELGIGNTTLGAILGAWPLVYIAAAIPAGALLDAIGVRTGLFLATLVILLSNLLRAWADTPVELLCAVGVFGLGGPLISVGAPKTISALFTGPSRGMAIGIYMTGPNVGAILALSLTGSLLLPLTGSWRGVMMVHAGFALIAGLVWLIAAGVSPGTNRAADREPFSAAAVGALVRSRDVVLVLAMAVGIFYINHALNNWLPALLRASGMDAQTAGYWASIPTAVGLVAALTIPRLATPERRLPMLIALFGTAFVASLLLASGQSWPVLAGLILQGLVRGAMNSIAILVLMELPSVPQHRVGLAGGVFFAAAEIGGVLGPFTFGVLRDATGDFQAPIYSLTLVSLALAALGLLLMRQSRKD